MHRLLWLAALAGSLGAPACTLLLHGDDHLAVAPAADAGPSDASSSPDAPTVDAAPLLDASHADDAATRDAAHVDTGADAGTLVSAATIDVVVGHSPVGGAIVSFLDASGAVLATVTTGASGHAEHDLPEGGSVAVLASPDAPGNRALFLDLPLGAKITFHAAVAATSGSVAVTGPTDASATSFVLSNGCGSAELSGTSAPSTEVLYDARCEATGAYTSFVGALDASRHLTGWSTTGFTSSDSHVEHLAFEAPVPVAIHVDVDGASAHWSAFVQPGVLGVPFVDLASSGDCTGSCDATIATATTETRTTIQILGDDGSSWVYQQLDSSPPETITIAARDQLGPISAASARERPIDLSFSTSVDAGAVDYVRVDLTTRDGTQWLVYAPPDLRRLVLPTTLPTSLGALDTVAYFEVSLVDDPQAGYTAALSTGLLLAAHGYSERTTSRFVTVE